MQSRKELESILDGTVSEIRREMGSLFRIRNGTGIKDERQFGIIWKRTELGQARKDCFLKLTVIYWI